MKAIYKITENDYIASARMLIRLNIKLLLKQLLIQAGIVIALIALFLSLASRGSEFMSSLGAFGGAFPFIIMGVVFGMAITALRFLLLAIRYMTLAGRCRQNYQISKGLQEEQSIELLDEGLHYSSANGYAKQPWDNIVMWLENEKLILIFASATTYRIVPKSISSQNFDISLLRSQLTQHIGKSLKDMRKRLKQQKIKAKQLTSSQP